MHIHDVLIIGAGPCGLAVAARLHEHTPSATFTDDEHQRYHWIRKHGNKMNIRNWRKNSDITSSKAPSQISSRTPMDLLVLDADGADWMTKWNRLFSLFGIQHLRSPMFFHVDPSDRDALLAYAYSQGRESELQCLPGCAGKEMSKHRKKKRIDKKARGKISQSGPDIDERDRKDYFTPSTKVFQAHFEEVIRQYGLGKELVRQERVVDIAYDEVSAFANAEHDSVISDDGSETEGKVFKVKSDKGLHYAHVVILAIGPGNAPSIPAVPGLPSLTAGTSHPGFSHAMHLQHFPTPHLQAKIEAGAASDVLIVGGGLTSVQLADVAIKKGVRKVRLLMRGDVKVKYFDIGLDWVGKFRNVRQAEFWSADSDEERLEMFLEARNGGSITPRYRKILNTHIASGKISLYTYTTLGSVSWDAATSTWSTILSTASPNSLPISTLPPVDYIIFATGVQSDVKTLPMLQTLHETHPVNSAGGLPCLTEDMMWSDNVPLFVSGRFAGLRLGPGAPNLVGARIGAERVAWGVEDVIGNLKGSAGEKSRKERAREDAEEWTAARANRYDSLGDDISS
ncbi:FAD/NAD(P)-binding domain-containing protein [Byssothecium circinans]|uniref:FAD/NAD(P)-binding domain-containing protein n=1 Tax=Byssothecium circinans TaxID=147558 RepID=A0A6A5U4V1_9PLEO|nr:FAD/NAD(P)-binding domain-containing protein [Byssothecium circinans]